MQPSQPLEPKGSSSPPIRIVSLAILVFLGAALSLSRQPGAGALDTLWAEDGSVFLQQALDNPSPSAWFASYAGYAHLLPRMVASFSALFPLDFAPWIYSGGAALIIAGLSLFVFRATVQAIPNWPIRCVVAATVLLLPSASMEVMNSSANLHWYLLFAASWAALWRPTGGGDVAATSLVLFLAATSDPFTVVVAPILALQYLRERRSSDLIRNAALLLGLALQAAVVFFNDQPRSLDPTSASSVAMLQWYGYQVIMTSALGVSLRDMMLETLGTLPTACIALAVLALLLSPALQAASRNIQFAGALVSLHLALYFLPVALAGTSPSRYAVAPILLLYSLIAWGFATCPPSRRLKVLAVSSVALLVVVVAPDFARINERAQGPSWSEELARGRSICSSGAISTSVTVPPKSSDTSTVKSTSEAGWTVRIPCDHPDL